MIRFGLHPLFLFVVLVTVAFPLLPCVVAAGPLVSIFDEDFCHGDTVSASQTAKAVVSAMILLLLNNLLSRQGKTDSTHKGRIVGTKTRHRKRARLHDIFNEYGPVFFRRAYRMKEPSFWRLLDLIEAKMGNKRKRKRGRTPNGDICNGTRLAMALRYFAGGDPIDIAAVYKVNRSLVYESVWLVVQAINNTKELDIKFPTKHDEQQNVAVFTARRRKFSVA